ncbi:MAG: acetamidase/formamidase family protein [Verrucomicrobia bacterium]|nr:acetamidase/formamidase family protein [Verrucomicrobiota bacterium]
MKISQEIHVPKKFAYTFGPNHRPIATVQPGETVRIFCVDAAEDRITRASDLPSKRLNFPFLNPQTGPVVIEGAEKGDTLVVEIHEITPTRDWVWSALIPDFGGLTSTSQTATLNAPLPEKVWIYPLKDGFIHVNKRIKIPYQPFMGTMGTSPEIESISSLAPGNYGGNMDCADICPGNKILFPVRVSGAHFFTGDVHAAQGDGELCGVACELAGAVTVTFNLLKGRKMDWPRVVSPDAIMSIGSARPMEDAARIAWRDLVLWMEADFGFDRLEAYQLLSQVGVMRLGNMVDTLYSMVAKCPMRYLPKTKLPC